MKMIKFLAVVLTISILVLAGCGINLGSQTVRGSGNLAKEERSLSGVQRVGLATLGDLTISLGDQEKLIIEAEANLLPYLTSLVREGKLEIASEPGTNLQPTQPIRFHLIVKDLDGLETTSSGNISAPELRANQFTITSSSSGDIDLAGLFADILDVEMSSLGDVTINAGEIPEQDIEIDSSGNYNAQNVLSQRATVRLNSNGNATVRVSDSMQADLTSNGNLNYYGNPRLDIDSSSSGRAIKAGD
jgi:hypothetical protein